MAIMGLNDTEESRQLNAQYQVEVSKTLQKIASSTAPEPLFDLSDQELGLLRGDVDAIKQYFPETESNSPSRQAFYGLFDNESTKNRLKSFSEMGVTLVIGKDGTIGGNRELNGGGVQSLGISHAPEVQSQPLIQKGKSAVNYRLSWRIKGWTALPIYRSVSKDPAPSPGSPAARTPYSIFNYS